MLVTRLLHLAGMEDLQDPGPIPGAGDFYFRVEENIPYERHVFRQLPLQEGETADQFMVHLSKQIRNEFERRFEPEKTAD